MEVAEFRWKILAKSLSDLIARKTELEKKFTDSNTYKSSETIKEFNEINREIESLETKYNESFSQMNINSNKVNNLSNLLR